MGKPKTKRSSTHGVRMQAASDIQGRGASATTSNPTTNQESKYPSQFVEVKKKELEPTTTARQPASSHEAPSARDREITKARATTQPTGASHSTAIGGRCAR